MSEAAARIRQPIDLDEFERRLRAGEIGTTASSDPVAELARLVGHADPFRAPPVAPQLRPAAGWRAPAHEQRLHRPFDAARDEPVQPQARGGSDVEAITFPDMEVLDDHGLHGQLRETLHDGPLEEAGQFPAAEPSSTDRDPRFAAENSAFIEQGVMPTAAMGAQEAPRRSWRGVIILSTILATGFAGLAGALTMKGSLLAAAKIPNTAKNGVPVILASGPPKVQPPASGPEAVEDQASVLDRTATIKGASAKVVNNVEQPVDLALQKPKASPAPTVAPMAQAKPVPPAAAPASGGTYSPQSSRAQVASLEPVFPGPAAPIQNAPPPPAPAVVRGPDEASPPAGPAGFPTPKRVKVISVRPDGSIIGSEQEASAPPSEAAAPGKTEAASQPEQTPKPAGLGTAPPRASDAVASLIEQGHPANVAPPAPHPIANAAVKAEARQAVAKPKHPKAKPIEVADLNADAGRAAKDGNFAAQLAASPSEAAAKSTLHKLQKKYGSAFSGHRLSYHRVRVDGKTVYRVRLGGLSKEDADSVCGKLQSDGGSCFVASN